LALVEVTHYRRSASSETQTKLDAERRAAKIPPRHRMPTPTPEPNSPEALRQARKVRDIFFMIAIVNIVLIFIVMCTRHEPSPPAPTPQLTPTPAPK